MTSGRLRQTHPTDGQVFSYQVKDSDGDLRVTLDGAETALRLHLEGSEEGWCQTSEGISHAFAFRWVGKTLHLWLDGDLYVFEPVESTERSSHQPVDSTGDVLAPMPGTVMQVLVDQGSSVAAGDRLFILESMKMELVIDAPKAGVVKRVAVVEGSQVDLGMRLLEFEEPTE